MTDINKPGDKPAQLPSHPARGAEKPDNELPKSEREKPEPKDIEEEIEELPPGHEYAWRPEDGPEPPPPGINAPPVGKKKTEDK